MTRSSKEMAEEAAARHSAPDRDRRRMLRDALSEAELDALACALPMNVLMMSGYAPVIGASVAICNAAGEVAIVAPKDEETFAQAAAPDHLEIYSSGGLSQLGGAAQFMAPALDRALRKLGLRSSGKGSGAKVLGVESGETHVPVTYSAVHLFGGELQELLADIFTADSLVPAGRMLARLRSVKSPQEIARIRRACAMAQAAFESAASNSSAEKNADESRRLHPGMSQREAAGIFMAEFDRLAAPRDSREAADDSVGNERSGAFFWCMAGEDSALAGAAFARSTASQWREGESLLVHANTHCNGYWTDITRTYLAASNSSGPTREQREVFEGVLAARAAALAAIRPGVPACEVDTAARSVISQRRFGDFFAHGTGHEVGFGAINAQDVPRIHPASPDLLEEGMVFNVEPAIYLPGKFGVRHCDMVAVTRDGCELLTPFQSTIEELTLASRNGRQI